MLPVSLVSSFGMYDDDRSESSRGIATGLGAYLMWGILTVFWKQLDGFDAIDLIGWRVVTAVAFLLVLVAWQGRLSVVFGALKNPRLAGRITVAALLLLVNWTLYVWAVVNGHVIETALGYFIAPLLTVILGVVALRERLRVLQRVALVFAAISVAVLTVAYGRPPFVALAIAGSWAVYGLMKKQVPLRPVESITAETLVLAVPSTAMVIVSLARTDPMFAGASSRDVVLVLLTGLFTAIPLLLFAHAALRLPLATIGPMQYLVPVINFLLGWLAFGEPVDTIRFIGFSLVWIGLVCSFVDTLRRRIVTPVVPGAGS